MVSHSPATAHCSIADFWTDTSGKDKRRLDITEICTLLNTSVIGGPAEAGKAGGCHDVQLLIECHSYLGRIRQTACWLVVRQLSSYNPVTAGCQKRKIVGDTFFVIFTCFVFNLT